ncbi:MAG: guanylate kinase [Gammaproteobacteria bacterium]|nr:guanylate kinase [Gammaproteobacteria bacterium]OUV75026.1 MAG: guanylate kinase [Gammaproteobacteria bacterium TMED139]
MKQGTLFIVTAPSGAGKTSLVNELLHQIKNLLVSVSHTTRPIRPGETNGKNYHFIDERRFLSMLSNGDFLETADVYGYKYGTSSKWVSAELGSGNDVILEIDWQGAIQIKRQFPGACSIFILPPSLEALIDRLHKRQQDDDETIARRMAQAKEVISHVKDADYAVVNDRFDETVNEVSSIIQSRRLKIEAQMVNLANLLANLAKD